MWLIDNNVPRQVTRLLRDRGDDVVEVRQVLVHSASDAAIAAYARGSGRRVVTHDVRFARVCRSDRVPHLWLRTMEADDVPRLAQEIALIDACFSRGTIRVVLSRTTVRCEGGAGR